MAPLVDSAFLPESYLKRHNLELLCAPVSLSSCMDVSGQSGTVTLNCPGLLRIRPRSLVIYMKAYTAGLGKVCLHISLLLLHFHVAILSRFCLANPRLICNMVTFNPA